MFESHRIRVIVNLLAVKLHVRFPCKLTFQLKSQSSSSTSQQTYVLHNGECSISECLECQEEASFDVSRREYQSIDMKIFIEMISNNGVIPAGMVSFNPNKKAINEKVKYSLPLAKCPDKNAVITFEVELQLIEKLGLTVSQANFDRKIQAQSINGLNNSKISQKMYGCESNYQKISPNSRKSPSNLSNHSRNASYKEKSVRSPVNKYRQSYVITLEDEKRHFQTFSKKISPQYVTQQDLFDEFEGRSSRQFDTEQKSNLFKEIGKLKGEIRNLKASDKLAQSQKAKEENQALIQQLDQARERLKVAERRQRDHTIQLKDTRQELQRTKNKNTHFEASKREIQSQLQRQEKQIRQLQQQKNKLNDKVQDLTIQLANNQKKNELKEISLQQQLKAISQKGRIAQNQRQKQSFEYHNLLVRLEDSEKRSLIVIKEKEKIFVEEKSRFTKTIEQMNQEITKYKQTIQLKQLHLQQQLSLVLKLSTQNTDEQIQLQSLQKENKSLNIKLNQISEQKSQQDKQITTYKQIQEERNTFRKKNQEINILNAQLTQKLDVLLSQKLRNDSKIKEIQISLFERTRDKEELVGKLNTALKQNENYKKAQGKYVKEMHLLTTQCQSNLQKYNELKCKYDSEKKEVESLLIKSQQQITYLTRLKEYRDNQIDELKATIGKNLAENEQITNRLKVANDNTFKLNQQIFILGKTSRRFSEENQEKKEEIDKINLQLSETQKRQRVINETLKNRNDVIFEYEKKLKTVESQLSILKFKLKEQSSRFEEGFQQIQLLNKEKQRELNKKVQQITNINFQIELNKQSIEAKDHQISFKNNQIQALSGNTHSLKLELANKDKIIASLTEKSKEDASKLQAIVQELQKLGLVLEQKKQQCTKIKEQWQEYHKNTKSALQKLIEQVGRQENEGVIKYNLLHFPDETLSAMQVQIIKRKNQLSNKFNLKISALNEEKDMIEAQLVQLKKRASERSEELQKRLSSERATYKSSISLHQNEKEELLKQIQQRDETILSLKNQIQKSINENKKIAQTISQLTDETNQIRGDRQILRQNIRILQLQILDYKSSQVKLKKQSECQILPVYGEKELIIDQLKGNIGDLQRKVFDLNKNIQTKNQTIKILQKQVQETSSQISQKKYEVQKLNSVNQRIFQQKSQVEKKYNLILLQQKQLQLALESQKQSSRLQKLKIQQLQGIRNNISDSWTQSLIQNQKLVSTISTLSTLKSQCESKLKENQSKYQSSIENITKELISHKNKCIEMTSDVELKIFHVSQLQTNNSALKEELQQLKIELEKRRKDCLSLSEQNQSLNSLKIYSAQSIQSLSAQKEALEKENERLKEKACAYEQELDLAQEQNERVERKVNQMQFENQKLLVSVSQYQQIQEASSVPMRGCLSGVNIRKGISSLSQVGQDKKRIRQVQLLLEKRHVDVAVERRKFLKQLQRQKKMYVSEINSLKEEINNLHYHYNLQSSLMPLSQEQQSPTPQQKY